MARNQPQRLSDFEAKITSDRRTLQCPRCHDIWLRPFAVCHASGGVVVHLVCEICGIEGDAGHIELLFEIGDGDTHVSWRFLQGSEP